MMQRVQRKKHKLDVIKDVRKDANGGPPNRQQRSRGDLEEESAKTSMYNKIKRSWRG
jgi:type III secretory pathway component EscU